MCGIAGISGPAAEKSLALRMLESIKHRGRDDQGVFADSGIGFGCNRLSIIDVAGGHQPVSTDDGEVWVVQNGEIYNHDELRAELQKCGHKFATRSDTEVIAQVFKEWGADSFARLDGMFVVAIWDVPGKTLHLARDRVGVKPLYFAETDGNLLFGSEIKAILAAGLLKKTTVNRRMVDQLVEVGYPLEPETLLNEVHQLPPGSRAKFDSNRFEVSSFWQPPAIVDAAPTVEQVRDALRRSIVHQTITSDVPVAAFLSGGIDTSTVVAFASGVRSDPLKTFCMGFNEATDEFADARIVAEKFGTDHREIMVDASDAMKIYPKMVWHSELPKINLYSWFVNEAASKHVKVCLSGLGGDELFAGYPTSRRFQTARRIRRLRRLGPVLAVAELSRMVPNRYARLLRSLHSDADAYATLVTGFPSEEVSSTVKELVKPFFNQPGEFEQKMVRAEFSEKLPYDYLLVEDAMSMAHTLEVRVPLLDDILLDLMLPVPYKYNATPSQGKLLLREAVKNILPPQCLAKPKWGFSVDVYSWWKRSVRDYALKRIPESKFLREATPNWHRKVSEKIAQPVDVQNSRWYSMAWIMLGLDVWADLFLNKQTPQSLPW
ncbi:MAG: asparagine synthase (glutamine-hydrolyzing) [Candidatus Bathyarchaeia archaeon]